MAELGYSFYGLGDLAALWTSRKPSKGLWYPLLPIPNPVKVLSQSSKVMI
jgi:hypothetical protein